ncbi:Glycine N-acyltransferase-like protein 2, partial [Camelus dromedarius]
SSSSGMFVLQEPQKLQILYESLEKTIPESIKVYGAIFNIKNKNPFNMEVLVDAWPDYQIVITRPQKEMKDDLDYYTNTYHIFNKAPDKLEEVLACPQVINWEQAFQIQVQVDYMKTMLFMAEKPVKLKTSIDDKLDWMKLFKMPNMEEDRREGNFTNIFLDVSHAQFVNEHWDFGKNERSLKYIEHCLQNFPGLGVLGPEGHPIS